MRSRLLVVAAVCVFLLMGSTTFGAGQERMVKVSFIDNVIALPQAQCDGFQIWGDWVAQYTLIMHLDDAGVELRENNQYRVLGDSVYYNSMDPKKAVSGGPGEVQLQTVDYVKGIITLRGISWKIRIPGAGIILAETGISVIQCDPGTLENCAFVRSTGWNQVTDGDWAAVCNYLQ